MKKLLKSLANRLLSPFDIEINQRAIIRNLTIVNKTYEEIINFRHQNNLSSTNTECIIFSKDRAMQLHALLSSYYENVINPTTIHILYKATDTRHKNSYKELFEIFKDKSLHVIPEVDFRKQLIELLESIKSPKMFFLTDDAVFLEPFDVTEFAKFNPYIYVPTLTKGLDLTYCFAFQKEQPLPSFIENIIQDVDKKCWIWADAENSPDWAYPLSVDGTLFSTIEMKIMASHIEFKSPNSFEGNLQIFNNVFKQRYGICYKKAKLANVPCNMVQSEFSNATTGFYNSNELLDYWERGFRVNYEIFYGQDSKKVQQAKYEFVKRAVI